MLQGFGLGGKFLLPWQHTGVCLTETKTPAAARHTGQTNKAPDRLIPTYTTRQSCNTTLTSRTPEVLD